MNAQGEEIQGIAVMLIGQQVKLVLNAEFVNTDTREVAFFLFPAGRL
ncbi:MAG TPA: hypothetical protein PLX02_09185 [Syntrophorhabdaceae bacterium]|nr:hypothetical protein [Syntrophorhabdaceae bacterium]HQM81780.1 hypothetical protein [Syntrophorhabdaceae bacterium]